MNNKLTTTELESLIFILYVVLSDHQCTQALFGNDRNLNAAMRAYSKLRHELADKIGDALKITDPEICQKPDS